MDFELLDLDLVVCNVFLFTMAFSRVSGDVCAESELP